MYAALLTRRGAVPLALACAIAWLAFASLGLLIVLVVSSEGRSFGTAGLTVGAFSATASVLAPLRGRIVDRRGNAPLLAFATGHAGSLVALLVNVQMEGPAIVTVACAASAGAMAPPLIGVARASWSEVAGAELIRTAHALTAFLGDAALVVGPLAASLLAAAVGAGTVFGMLAAMPLAAAVLIVGLGLQPRRAPMPRSKPGGSPLRNAGMRTIAACGVALGITLGALVVGAPAVASDVSQDGLSGVPIATFAAGSVLISLWAGRSPHAGDPGRRYVLGCAIVGCATVACLLMSHTIAGLAATLLLAGGGYGLLNVAAFELLDEVAARENAVEALTWLTSAESLGVGAGGALAGALAGGGAGGALLVVAIAGPVAAALAIGRRGTVMSPVRRHESLRPTHAEGADRAA